jgi:hypothetical protein
LANLRIQAIVAQKICLGGERFEIGIGSAHRAQIIAGLYLDA